MTVLVIGQNCYGHAADLKTAKKNFTAQGGQLRRGYTIADFGAGLTFTGVDEIGRVHWQGVGEPTVTEVPGRR